VTEAATGTVDVCPRLVDAKVWFETPAAHEVMSSVTVTDDRVYFGTMKASGFRQSGAVVAVDRATGALAWQFTDDGGLMPVFTTPAVSGERVFAGEGLHTDADRRLFALDAATGKPVWTVTTTSHTEGNPLVSNGKVYFSAGDDGLYCVTADTGKEVWHLRGAEQKLHVDTPAAVANGTVFLGSGYSTLALLALDAETGKERWRTPTTLRSFGPPLPLGKHVVYGLGTGNLAEDLSQETDGTPSETTPAGAVVCLDSATGKEVWRAEFPKSVHTQLAADARAVYAACRDGTVSALDRTTGKLLWKRTVGPSFTAGPSVVSFAGGAVSLAVYAVASDGTAACLSPLDGRVLWVRPLADVAGRDVQAFASPVVVPADAEGRRRYVYIGAGLTNRNNRAKAAAVFRIEDAAGDP
jgi:outer membrane protein assembly factor BamB